MESEFKLEFHSNYIAFALNQSITMGKCQSCLWTHSIFCEIKYQREKWCLDMTFIAHHQHSIDSFTQRFTPFLNLLPLLHFHRTYARISTLIKIFSISWNSWGVLWGETWSVSVVLWIIFYVRSLNTLVMKSHVGNCCSFTASQI